MLIYLFPVKELLLRPSQKANSLIWKPIFIILDIQGLVILRGARIALWPCSDALLHFHNLGEVKVIALFITALQKLICSIIPCTVLAWRFYLAPIANTPALLGMVCF